MEVDRAGVERRPAAVDPLGDVADDAVGVQLRVELTRCGMDEARDGEAGRDVTIASTEATARAATLLFQERERRGDRFAMCGGQRGPKL